MSGPGSIRMDATCYGSDMRYPTDIKLLWKAVGWDHHPLKGHCKVLGPPCPVPSSPNKPNLTAIGPMVDLAPRCHSITIFLAWTAHYWI